MNDTPHPCLQCGACCAAFRVSFYWADAAQRGLDERLTELVNPFYACMKGTWSATPRCIALEGEIGKQTTCRVYEQRPEPCRQVQPGDDQCNKARAKYGLPQLSPLCAKA